MDKVQVPQNIAPGSYALSFRYDCEQTSQVSLGQQVQDRTEQIDSAAPALYLNRL
jgi:hypothetical protein